MSDTTVRSSNWSLTINNPTPDDEDYIQLARQRGWRVDGQKEVGKEGTVHYQLHLATPQVRFSAVKKAFPRAHIEVARNPAALASYVKKEETRVGSLAVAQDKYPSQSRFFELIWDLVLATPEDYYFRFGSHRFVGEGKPHRLAYWKAASDLIARGYHVENMAVNPMTLAAWDAFHPALLRRKIAGETARQADTRLDPGNANVAVEHNHAVSSSSVQAQAPP